MAPKRSRSAAVVHMPREARIVPTAAGAGAKVISGFNRYLVTAAESLPGQSPWNDESRGSSGSRNYHV